MAISKHFKRGLAAIGNFVFPQGCVACGQEPYGDQLCLSCSVLVGSSDHFSVQKNELFSRLALRCELEFAAALGIFTKGGPYQSLLHELKYGGVLQIGYKLGRSFGRKYIEMKNNPIAEIIIPIPIHWGRKLKRGYNQAEIFAKGIERETNIPVRTDILSKRIGVLSQTKKNRIERMNNIYDSFVCKNTDGVDEKRVLLVDDVLTTGATVEAAITALNKKAIGSIQLGLIALATNS